MTDVYAWHDPYAALPPVSEQPSSPPPPSAKWECPDSIRIPAAIAVGRVGVVAVRDMLVRDFGADRMSGVSPYRYGELIDKLDAMYRGP